LSVPVWTAESVAEPFFNLSVNEVFEQAIDIMPVDVMQNHEVSFAPRRRMRSKTSQQAKKRAARWPPFPIFSS